MKQRLINQHEQLRELLKNVRVSSGLTQADLADRLKMPQSFVSKYESGERRLDVLELRAICKAMGLSLVEFLRKLEKELA